MNGKFQEEYQRKLMSVEDAAKLIKSGDKIVGGMGLAEAHGTLTAIGKRAIAKEFDDVEYINMGPHLSMEWQKPEVYPHLRSSSGFPFTPVTKKLINSGHSDFLPCHGADLPIWITEYMIKDRPPGTTYVSSAVTPMDKYGYFCYATSPAYQMDAARAENATVMLEVNNNQPWVAGDNFIHISEVDHIVEYDFKLASYPAAPPTPVDEAIAHLIVDMIEDGSTIQLGIGGMPNVLGKLLESKHDLGASTEMIGDAVMHLWEKGVLTGKKKTVRPYKITGCFTMASEEVYRWMDHNPALEMYSQGWTNDPFVIAQNYKMVAINQALEVDLTGQVASEGIGPRHYSGTGGQFHFTQGAQRSPGGKAFICLPSTAETSAGRVSTIVPLLKHGSVVTTPRTEVQYVVTEYGIAQLKGKSMKERAKALVEIAHPDFRGELREEAKKLALLL